MPVELKVYNGLYDLLYGMELVKPFPYVISSCVTVVSLLQTNVTSFVVDDLAPDVNYKFKIVPVSNEDVFLPTQETRWVQSLRGITLFVVT